MILTPHAVVGASIASVFKLSPFTALVVGFVSHFILDMIPHFDYKLRSVKIEAGKTLDGDIVIDKTFFADLIVLGVDLSVGLFLAWLFFVFTGAISLPVALAGAIGGVLPDALQFVYYKFGRRHLRPLQSFHARVHNKIRLKDPVWGTLLYGLIISTAFLVGVWRFFVWVA